MSELGELMAKLRTFDALGASVQKEITEALAKDPAIAARLEAFAKLPGNVTSSKIHQAVVDFVNALPFADSVHINMFTTALSHHAAITGNSVLAELSEIINHEVVEQNVSLIP